MSVQESTSLQSGYNTQDKALRTESMKAALKRNGKKDKSILLRERSGCAGEYIAPERIEGVLKKAGALQQAYIHGNPFESSLVAIVVPDEAELRYSPSLSSHLTTEDPPTCVALPLRPVYKV